jgi:DNA-binding beta-propeller fold protein YncE
MSKLMYSRMLGLVALAASLIINSGLEAGDGQPLERVAVIQLKGVAGTLDHLGADLDNARLFVANESNNTLDVIDLKSNVLIKQVAGQKEIHGIAYARDLNRIFVGNGEGVCNALDGRDYSLLKSVPVPGADSVRYDPGTHHVFVAADKGLAVIDANSHKLLGNVKLHGPPYGFQIAAESQLVYVNTSVPCAVSVVDANKREVVARYPLGAHQGIGPLTLDEANRRIFVGLRRQPRFAVLNMESGKECASLPIPEGSDDMTLDATSKRIYISCNSGFVAVIRQIDADHYESVADVPTIKGAKTSLYDPTTKRLYVVVPRQAGKEGPEVWVFQARP